MLPQPSQTTSTWETSVQTHEPLGYISHSNHTTTEPVCPRSISVSCLIDPSNKWMQAQSMDCKLLLLQKLERLDQHTLAVAHLIGVFQALGEAAQIAFQDLFILFYECLPAYLYAYYLYALCLQRPMELELKMVVTQHLSFKN